MSSSSSNQSSSSSANASFTRGIGLRRFDQTPYRTTEAQGFRMVVKAYGAHLMPSAIFRYIRGPLNPALGTLIDEFDGVCSPADLEFAEDAPRTTDNPAWYRRDTVDMVVRSQAEAEYLWVGLLAEVQALVNALDIMDVLVPGISVVAGSPPYTEPPSELSLSSEG